MQQLDGWLKFLKLKGWVERDRDWVAILLVEKGKFIVRQLARTPPPGPRPQIAADEVAAAAADLTDEK